MDPNAERGLAVSVFTLGPLDGLDDELRLVRGLYHNSAGPSTLDDVSTFFGIVEKPGPWFLVTFEELRRRGIVEGASLGGRDLYDLTKEFRSLVDSEYQKCQSNEAAKGEHGLSA